MAGSKSDYLEKRILDHFLGATASTPAATVYIALSTAAYSDAATSASMAEVSGGSYARVAVTNNATNWPAATGTSPATKQNGTAFTFPTASGAWGTVTSFYIVDVISGAGNVYYGGDLTVAKPVTSGDTASFAINAITITED